MARGVNDGHAGPRSRVFSGNPCNPAIGVVRLRDGEFPETDTRTCQLRAPGGHRANHIAQKPVLPQDHSGPPSTHTGVLPREGSSFTIRRTPSMSLLTLKLINRPAGLPESRTY